MRSVYQVYMGIYIQMNVGNDVHYGILRSVCSESYSDCHSSVCTQKTVFW